MQKIAHSQNFLVNNNLVSKLVSNSMFNQDDIVLDIGAGRGIITNELAKYSKNIIAIEIDEHLFLELLSIKGIKVVKEDFLIYELPQMPFKTFSNT
jgi:23S rRNA (adenine-N6)-dimethyltransferase